MKAQKWQPTSGMDHFLVGPVGSITLIEMSGKRVEIKICRLLNLLRVPNLVNLSSKKASIAIETSFMNQ